MSDQADDSKIPPAAKPYGDDLPPPDFDDPVIEFYKKDVDRTLLRENLKLTPDERFRKFESFVRYVEELRQNAQGTYVTNHDVIVGPLVTQPRIEQQKFQTQLAQSLLNDPLTQRSVRP